MYRRRKRGVNILLSTASILLFALTTADIILQGNHIVIGLLYTPGDGKDLYFENVGNWAQVTQSSIALFTMLIGDGIMIYRVYMVWGKRWIVVAFNAFLWLGTIACSVRSVQLQAAYMQDQANLDILITEDHWTLAAIAFSLTSTTLATGMIAFQIWRIDRTSSKSKTTSLLPVIRIVVESGCLYLAFLCAYLVALVLESPALLFLNQIVSPITSIAFYSIIVRVGLSKYGGSSTTLRASESGPGSMAVHHEFSGHRSGNRLSVMKNGEMIGMKEMENSSSLQLDV
ncbi:hypothetical protein CALCODRAFT_483170 [Calocera cornea HHB12733]|uniref:Uncharacterized protein n=1 Tax=Calocera cornea HHB12733 TaxID=1353952 RepID=A0A165G1X5_9BASI|nr:hypothetical protein CALCODRAFT_483170 [Calocera cornea HHB12733]